VKLVERSPVHVVGLRDESPARVGWQQWLARVLVDLSHDIVPQCFEPSAAGCLTLLGCRAG
jgi:hypothetical protein